MCEESIFSLEMVRNEFRFDFVLQKQKFRLFQHDFGCKTKSQMQKIKE